MIYNKYIMFAVVISPQCCSTVIFHAYLHKAYNNNVMFKQAIKSRVIQFGIPLLLEMVELMKKLT